MAYYHECPYCGANLDPDERCDCREKAPARNSTGTKNSLKLYYKKCKMSSKNK